MGDVFNYFNKPTEKELEELWNKLKERIVSFLGAEPYIKSGKPSWRNFYVAEPETKKEPYFAATMIQKRIGKILIIVKYNANVNDPKGLLKPTTFFGGVKDRCKEFYISSEDQLDDAIGFIKQSLDIVNMM